VTQNEPKEVDQKNTSGAGIPFNKEHTRRANGAYGGDLEGQPYQLHRAFREVVRSLFTPVRSILTPFRSFFLYLGITFSYFVYVWDVFGIRFTVRVFT
jgi:hypothetical protein